jgi:hypothetical protein
MTDQARKLPIDRPCSVCSAGDDEMKYHDHEPPFRAPQLVEQAEREIAEETAELYLCAQFRGKAGA